MCCVVCGRVLTAGILPVCVCVCAHACVPCTVLMPFKAVPLKLRRGRLEGCGASACVHVNAFSNLPVQVFTCTPESIKHPPSHSTNPAP